MSIIQIDKKAITEEDGARLLVQTDDLSDPFSIPTYHIKLDDFIGLGKSDIYQRVEVELRCFFNEHDPLLLSNENNHIFKETLNYVVYKLQRPDEFDGGACSDDYNEEPKTNIIITPRSDMTVQEITASLLEKPGFATELPGTPAQYQYHIKWHERGHGIGAGEPQTEMIAAIMDRKAYEDTRFLAVLSDISALSAIFDCYQRVNDGRFGGCFVSGVRGYPMVEAIDYVRSLPIDVIDNLTEGQIKNIRFQKFNHLGDTVRDISYKLKCETGVWTEFENRDFKALDNAAEYLRKGSFFNFEKSRILRRFDLACQRISIGIPAYNNGEEHIDSRILSSEKFDKNNPPITIDPKFIPELEY